MKKSMMFALTILCALAVSGCDPINKISVDEEPNFCDLTSPRIFDHHVLVWRAKNDPENLRKDFKSNTDFERECVK